ncbi:hypothetical protein [uncultured Flavobacterium sp.]|uniref:hypothetical protein n=1 Tax=uncultured Flavobacterium sp. TaxID=165435 RepID=UPI0030EE2AED
MLRIPLTEAEISKQYKLMQSSRHNRNDDHKTPQQLPSLRVVIRIPLFSILRNDFLEQIITQLELT